jgi:hypothetical protein
LLLATVRVIPSFIRPAGPAVVCCVSCAPRRSSAYKVIDIMSHDRSSIVTLFASYMECLRPHGISRDH